jgi:hypothetical protein
LNRQFERGDQELCSIVSRVSRRDTANFDWRLGVSKGIDRGNAAGFGKCAGDVVLRRNADVLEFARIELDTRFADDLIDDLIAL